MSFRTVYKNHANVMHYLVLDRAVDFSLLFHKSDSEAYIVAIGAEAICGIPPSFPKCRILNLSSLITREMLASEVSLRVGEIWRTIADIDSCPYYKVKQILDATIEKQIIVEHIARLPGEKRYVKSVTQWISADGDNSESCRFAALFMSELPGFVAQAVCRQYVYMERASRILRLIIQALRALLNNTAFGRWHEGEILLGSAGYGAAKDFRNRVVRETNMGSVVASTLLAGNLMDTMKLLFHDRPIRIKPTQAERRHFYISLIRDLFKRCREVEKVMNRLAKRRISKADYYFTVSYGRLGGLAIVRFLRRQGIPCFTMQHAFVGHDTWTASQYHDLWESDAKLVANDTVATTLAGFEKPRNKATYLSVSLPMYRDRIKKPGWDGRSVLYILTGFTRSNTMYDNRRINDALYIEEVLRDLSKVAKRYETQIRSHPYDKRQYQDAICRHIASVVKSPQSNGTDEFAGKALAIIDSPSTILADMVLGGRPVILINRCGHLLNQFEGQARKHKILFSVIEDALSYLESVSVESLMLEQRQFSAYLINTFCAPSNELSIPQAIEKSLLCPAK